MAPPDFSKQTTDILARRARFQCSNPDCSVQTVGPNTLPDKAIVIGEAAHICGAKPGSTRYDELMSDATRAAVTNGIWLCRNCHAQIDRDATAFSMDLLLLWRKDHEERVLRELGTRGEKIKHDLEKNNLQFLSAYPEILHRIVIDKPDGWEWRFVAELMRFLNKTELKRLQDLNSGFYFRAYQRVRHEEMISWIAERTHVMSNLIKPLKLLFDRLTSSFGKPGEAGDLEEMYDVCLLIRDLLREVIKHEEVLRFTSIPDEGEELRELMTDAIGKNIKNIEELPRKLDEIVAMIGTDHGGTNEDPHIVTWKMQFSLPDYFVDNYEAALARYMQAVS